ncbi:hypothetical protein CDL60_10460 [Roseateles noduli]|nr:hypothetical protein CDL60_10460 [Roseateles noduli]
MPAEMIDTLLAGMYRSFDTHIRSTKSSGANLPGAEVIDDLCRWAFGKEENGLPTTRCQGRLLTALAIMTTEGRHAVKGLTVTDSLQDGTPLLLELPPRSLLSRTRAACERLSLILRVGHDSVQDPAAFADSVKAVSRTTLAVTATRKGRLPDGTAVPHIHQLDLSGLNDQGQDLFQFPGEFGRDLREMPHLRRIRAPESWSGNEDFREVCHCARVDIEWLDPSGLGVGRSCCRGVGNAVARLLRACRS